MMKVAGIIAEYNPFHLGHAYQIQTLRERYGADAVVCVMSGHFMQRGEPAMVNKRIRTRMALEQGADLVVELPALYATRSAWWFAFGGVLLLHRMGIVTHLAFGAEKDNLAQLTETARILSAEPSAFREALSQSLKSGVSFARAQSEALRHVRPDLPSVAEPNERLALNYLQIIETFALPLTPVLILRQGGGYHDSLPDGGGPPSVASSSGATFSSASPPAASPFGGASFPEAARPVASFPETACPAALFPGASAIRRHLQTAPNCRDGLDQLEFSLPGSSFKLLTDVLDQEKTFVFPDDMAPAIMALLKRASVQELTELPDMAPGLANRIRSAARNSFDVETFLDTLKTKRFSRSRLQRLLTFLFLNYTQETARYIREGPPYLRVLGFGPGGRPLLRRIKDQAALPVILRGGQLKALARRFPAVEAAWSLDIRAGDLYALLEKSPLHPPGSAEYYGIPYIY
jgi:predicted nucleotidyltransferase